MLLGISLTGPNTSPLPQIYHIPRYRLRLYILHAKWSLTVHGFHHQKVTIHFYACPDTGWRAVTKNKSNKSDARSKTGMQNCKWHLMKNPISPSWWFVQYIDIYFIIYQAKYPGNENKWAVRKIGAEEGDREMEQAFLPLGGCVI